MDFLGEATAIGDYAFYKCTALTEIIIPDAVQTIGNSAFQSCTNLATLTIGKGVTSIGTKAFYGCTKLATVTIGSGVTTIGEGAFKGNWYVTELYYNATNCTTVSSQAFAAIGGEVSGTTVTIGANVKALPANLFYTASTEYNITAVVFEGTKVTSIGENAFASCTHTTYTGTGTVVTYSITSVYYKGTAEQWSSLTSSENCGSGNEPLTSATVYYYSEGQPATEGNYWHYDDGKVTVWEATKDDEEEAA